MNVTTIMRGAEARCSYCGAQSIVAVCHHCGRPLCARDGISETDDSGRATTEEFTGLELHDARNGEVPVHCKGCRHILPKPPWVMLAAFGTAIVLGRLLQQEMPSAGLSVVLLGAVGVAVLGRMVWVRLRAIAESAPPVPTTPRFATIEATERVEGTMTMEADGRWSSRVSARTGRVSVRASFGEPDRRVLKAYLKKFRPSVPQGELRFCAGFLLLRERLAAELVSTDEASEGAALVLPVSGSVGDVPYLATHEGHGDRTWRAHWDYRVLAALARGTDPPEESGQGSSLPIRLIPSLVPNSDGRVLELDITWAESSKADALPKGQPEGIEARPGDTGLCRPHLEELAIDVPLLWGEVESLSGGGLQGIAPSSSGHLGPMRRVVWRNLALQSAGTGRSIARLQLHFRNRIDPSAEVKGMLALEFSGGISGLTAIDVFDPLGGLRAVDQGEVRTRIEGTFSLRLDILRHREHRVASGRGAEDVSRVAGLAPSHELVLQLARTLRCASFHIQRIEEEPPRVGSEAGRTKSLWDLSGQYRSGLDVFPVHVLVSGEGGGPSDRDGRSFTEVSTTLRGTVSDDGSKLRLDQALSSLRETVAETIREAQKGTPRHPRGATTASSQRSSTASSADLEPGQQN